MKTLNYGENLWLDKKFGIQSAIVWLKIIPEGDARVEEMLENVAKGEYPAILDEMDRFIVELMRSKHWDSEKTISKFFKSLKKHVLNKLDPTIMTDQVLRYLLLNHEISFAKHFEQRFLETLTRRSISFGS